MTPEQWTTLVGQLGVGGAAVFVILKVIVPLLTSKLDAIVSELGKNRDTTERNTAAVGLLTERVSRLEGIFDHHEHPTPIEGVPLSRRR